MKCPFRVDTQYPAVAGENWAYETKFDDCVSGECPLFVDGVCQWVAKIIAEKKYYETVLDKWDELIAAQ